MTASLLRILKPLANLAQDAEVTGMHQEALAYAIGQYNTVLEAVRADCPGDPVWQVLTPLDPARHGFSTLALSCNQLLEVASGTDHRRAHCCCGGETDGPCWEITKDTTISSCYEGSLVVEPGCRLLVTGSVEGDVTLRQGACLDLGGIVEGDVAADPGSVVLVRGCVEGDVNLFGHARLDLGGVIEGDVEADPESQIEYRGMIEGSVRTRRPHREEPPDGTMGPAAGGVDEDQSGSLLGEAGSESGSPTRNNP